MKHPIESAIESLVEAGFTLVLSAYADGEQHFVSGSAGNGTDQRRATCETVLDVLYRLNKNEPVKPCRKCKTVKPLSAFVNIESNPDGKSAVCLACARSTKKGSKR